jgi:hypothetical protein
MIMRTATVVGRIFKVRILTIILILPEHGRVATLTSVVSSPAAGCFVGKGVFTVSRFLTSLSKSPKECNDGKSCLQEYSYSLRTQSDSDASQLFKLDCRLQTSLDVLKICEILIPRKRE